MAAIYLIRHGQASFGSADYDQLSPLGMEQARVVGNWFAQRQITINAAFSGGMKRHQQTAECFAQRFGNLPTPHIQESWNEYDHEAILQAALKDPDTAKAFEAEMASGKDQKKTFQRLFEKAVSRWASGQFPDDYPESLPAFKARTMSALGQVAGACAKLASGSSVAVFTSGGPITSITAQLMGMPDNQAFKLNWVIVNCSITKILCSDSRLTLSSFNEHAHLEHGDHPSGVKMVSYR